MRMRVWAALVLVVGLLATGCVVDSIVRSQDDEIDGLQADVNEWRNRAAELTQILDVQGTEEIRRGPSLQIELQKKLEAMGFEVTADGEKLIITLVNSVLFDSGSTKLKSEATRVLDEVARILRDQFGDNIIRVEGHTDNVRPKKVAKVYPTNWELSATRSTVVLRYLVGRGVQRDIIYGAAFGDTQPVDTNSTDAGRRNNRRVDIVILPPLGVKKQYFR